MAIQIVSNELNYRNLFSCSSLDSYFKDKGIGASTRTNSQHENEFGTVPFWNYFIIKFQYYILYTYAGLVKLSPEWLSGYSMTYLGNHWVFTPFRLILGTVWTDLLIVHWFGCLFDLTVAFWLTHKRTRFIATFFAIAFHLMNTRLFHIGMFPWVCLAHLPLFYEVDWPRKLISRRRGPDARRNLIKSADGEEKTTGPRQKKTTLLLGLYIFLQLFLPNSHFITKGYNNWTKGEKMNRSKCSGLGKLLKYSISNHRTLWIFLEHDGQLLAANHDYNHGGGQ